MQTIFQWPRHCILSYRDSNSNLSSKDLYSWIGTSALYRKPVEQVHRFYNYHPPKVEKVIKVATKKSFLLFDVWYNQDITNSRTFWKSPQGTWRDIISPPSQDTQHITQGQSSKKINNLYTNGSHACLLNKLRAVSDIQIRIVLLLLSSFLILSTGDTALLECGLGQEKERAVKWNIGGYVPPVQCWIKYFWKSVDQLKTKWEPRGSQQQGHSQMAQLEVLMKWGRGDSFPGLVFGNRRLTKTLDTRSHLSGCSRDNPQGHCSANTHTYLY